jgi:hypothetical protein
VTIRLQEPNEPLTVVDEDRNARLMQVQGYVMLIKKPGDDDLYGPVENSFSLGIEPNRTFFFWTSLAQNIDGWEWVQRDLKMWKEKYPDWEYSIYDARDAEKLPVVLNWDLWLDAHQRSNDTLSGIKNKHEARNLRFTLKGKAADQRKSAPALHTNITTISLKGEL